MSEPMLKIPNHHAPGCGDPPMISGGNPAIYIGYFENSYGEQWIFTYDRAAKKGELRGGDVGWNSIQVVEKGRVTGLILNVEESAWLQSCWSAAVPRGT
jgi:hypothetical protein